MAHRLLPRGIGRRILAEGGVSLGSGLMRYTAQQRRIASETIGLFMSLMRGHSSARINPSAAIGPSGTSQGVRDASPGIGSVIDFQA